MSSSLDSIVLHEFEYSFGEVARALDEDGTIYDYFLNEFYKGVNHGLNNLTASREELEAEAAIRYLFEINIFLEGLDYELQDNVRECSGFIFLYGVFWGRDSVEIHN